MRCISDTVRIEAPPSRVWEVLTAFERYPEWNPFILEAGGSRVEGERLEIVLRPPGGRTYTLHPRVVSVVDEVELAWSGRLALPRLFDGTHRFLLEDLGDHVRLTQEETVSGLLIPFLGDLLRRTQEGLRLMDMALRDRAEALT